MFLDYLKETKAIDEIHLKYIKTSIDFEVRDILVRDKIIDEVTMKYLWGEYVRDRDNS